MTQLQANITPMVALKDQLWQGNPIFRQVLGICSTLAVTNLLFNTVLMCAGLIWATAMSAVTVSLLRNFIPQRVRIMASVLIAAVFVIVVDVVMRAYFTAIHQNIAAYVGLIITNCIVLGRMESFSIRNSAGKAFMDGLGAGLGYSFMLLAIACIREPLGFGTFFGVPVISDWLASANAQWVIMVMPPGGFFVLAMMVWAARSYDLRREARKKQAAPQT